MYKRFLFSMMVIAQLAVPCWMAYSMETVLLQGTPWRFKTAPVDPYDIFRGKFVALAVEQNKTDYHGPEQFSPRYCQMLWSENLKSYPSGIFQAAF